MNAFTITLSIDTAEDNQQVWSITRLLALIDAADVGTQIIRNVFGSDSIWRVGLGCTDSSACFFGPDGRQLIVERIAVAGKVAA